MRGGTLRGGLLCSGLLFEGALCAWYLGMDFLRWYGF